MFNQRQTKTSRAEKVEFLRQKFPNIEKLDFIGNQALFRDAKQALYDAGFYKKRETGSLSSINDASVMNLIWDAQGRSRYKHAVNKSTAAERRNRRPGV